MKNRTYNPLIMIGSWIGGFSLILIMYLILPNLIYQSTVSFLAYVEKNTGYYLWEIYGYAKTFSLGFLIGWGIHSLIKFMKR